MTPAKVTLNKPLQIGASILEISKVGSKKIFSDLGHNPPNQKIFLPFKSYIFFYTVV